MKKILTFAIFVVVAVFASGVLLAQSNPLIGTWKLNATKSKYHPGPAPYQSGTATYEAQGDGLKVSFQGLAADGSNLAWNYTANYDSQDNPVSGTGAPAAADTVSLRRINSNTTLATFRKGRKVVRKSYLTVSEDGKVMTITAKGTNAEGQRVSDRLVFDKQ